MKIVTFNANGIRSAARKGFFEWMQDSDPDVVCMQELKAHRDQLAENLLAPQGYRGYFQFAEKKGYSGTAIYCKAPPSDVKVGLGWNDFDSEGRLVRIDYNNLSIISIYLPSGTSSDDRQKFKEIILDRLKPVLLNFRKEKRDFIICGDINIAHKPVDLRNWKGNRNNSGFLPQERAWMDWLFGEAGYVDAFRVINSRPGQYTWWSNRGEAYAKNVGWRLDYHIVTAGLSKRTESVSVFRETKFSDHAPVIVNYDIAVQ